MKRISSVLLSVVLFTTLVGRAEEPIGFTYPAAPGSKRSADDAAHLSASCIACHGESDSHSMHASFATGISCIDCHGGNGAVAVPAGIAREHPQFQQFKAQAHVAPRLRDFWKTAANPQIPGARELQE